tara:strand:+ start:2446 stop:3261 length:816 start_codon:yes stop_codon:yes gene_type:complete
MPKVSFWGVQGSCPGSYFEENLGSNTSCISIELEDTLIILDAGTGIRTLCNTIDVNQFKQVALLLTHSHWDHIQGFPFFSYIYQNKPLIIFSHLHEHINGLLNQINGVNFPLSRETLSCNVNIITDINQLNNQLNIDITTIQTNHQGNCIGYRVKSKDCDVCYIPDNQLHNTSTTSFNEFVSFCQNSKILIHDSQYTTHDMPLKIDWGHSIYTDALKLAMEASVRQFVLFHHEPTRTKKDILTMADHCKSITKEVKIIAASELKNIDLLGN